jgi:alkyl hydroperoxide reductase subunit F
MYDLLIIGGGPAGVAAGVYAARKKIKTALITDMFGGQSVVSTDIQNFIGIPSISGFDLAQALEGHLRKQDDIEIILGDKVSHIERIGDAHQFSFIVQTERGKKIEAKTILVTAGSQRRRLGIPGEDKLDGKGVAYCATCDAPLFRGKRVALVGGGNSALEGARDIIPYASEVYLFVRNAVKGDPVTWEKISRDPKVKIVMPGEITEILGEDTVTGIRYRASEGEEIKEMALDGVFIEIGWMANSALAKELVAVNQGNEIIVDHKTQRTSCLGIWSAGDVTDALYKQNNTSMGDAIKAVLNINDYLHTGK